MKCFLHIGTEKTATTTIQNFFDMNRSKLLEKGFIYTKSTGKTNNRALSVAAYNLHRRDEFTEMLRLDTDEKLKLFQEQTIYNLIEEIEKAKKNNSEKKIIFSSEHLQSRLTDIKEIERLKKIIHEIGVIDTVVIVYLRRPADIANSLYSEKIKAGGVLEKPPLPKESPYFYNVCNHKKTLEKFGSVFGESAIIPKVFGKNEFKNGSIIDDILYLFGVSA